ncbi:MAG: adenylate kinase family protein [Halobacteriota archaeon]
MRVALTGTPGTGKTTVAGRLEVDLEVVHLGDVIAEAGLESGRDSVRETAVVDLDGLRRATAGREDVLFESHLSHYLDVDRVIVLRCHPSTLETRLRGRGFTERSIRENAESEALDVIVTEAVERHGREAVYEIDTTERAIETVVDEVTEAIRGEREPAVGTVDFTAYL